MDMCRVQAPRYCTGHRGMGTLPEQAGPGLFWKSPVMGAGRRLTLTGLCPWPHGSWSVCHSSEEPSAPPAPHQTGTLSKSWPASQAVHWPNLFLFCCLKTESFIFWREA
jgi:hypothetical protein